MDKSKLHIHQIGSVITVRNEKDEKLMQKKCNNFEEAERITTNLKKKWGVK